jgi:hypothetical protein
MFPGKFLEALDVPEPTVVKIVEVTQRDVAYEGDAPEFQYIAKLEGYEKPLRLNRYLAHNIAMVLESDDTTDWLHRRVALYWDPFVYYANRIMGAFRVRDLNQDEQEEDRKRAKRETVELIRRMSKRKVRK